ncbi:MAG: hypothetical protein D9V44_08445 [Actinobacteria bacterium]|nr:MAG: hypothetical protein D9V44_08445 [Actinomycetota bacterium]
MLTRAAWFIVRNRKAVFLVAGLLLVFGVFGLMNAKINYDMLSYVPSDLDSVKGFNVLTDDFQLGNTAQVMVVGATDTDVKRIVDQVATIDGIEAVSWVDDVGDLYVPREFWDTDMGEAFFAGDTTFFQASFTGSMNDPETRIAMNKMRDVLGDREYYIAGIQQMELEDVINGDRTKFAAAALILVAIALLLTVPSAIVPMLFVTTIGLAVIYNLGLSFYLGQETSYLTGVIVLALQFAVTMDYALFLYHRYEQERAFADNETAMATAMAATFKSVAGASLTTIAGFLALTVMRLGFGFDMGWTLARGVLITVIAVLTVLPHLLLMFDSPIRRFAHKVHLPDFHRLGGWIARHAGVVTIVLVLAFIPAVWMNSQVELTYNLDSALPEDLPSLIAADKMAEKFDQGQTFFIVAEETDQIRDLDALTKATEAVPGVSRAVSYTTLVSPLIPAEFVPEKARENFFKHGMTYITAEVPFGFGDPRTGALIDDLRSVAKSYPGTARVTGQGVLFRDLEDTSKGDVSRVNIISIIAIAIIVALVFRSLSIPALLLGAIELAIILNQGMAIFSGGKMIFIANLAIGAIQLGATVDYAILLTGRYQEELSKRRDREAAMREALGGSGPSIITSASTMFAATIGLVFLSSVSTVTDLTALIARGAVISFLVVMFLLPGVLVLAQPVLERTSLGWPRIPRK